MQNYRREDISTFDKIIVYLVIASAFLDGLFIRFAYFDFYWYYIIYVLAIIVSLFRFGKEAFGPKSFIKMFLVLFLISIVTGAIYGTLGFLMYKQIFGICFSALACWSIFLLSRGDLKFLGLVYINVAFFEALYGLSGEVSYMLGFYPFGVYEQLSNLIGSAKIMGTTSEPYFFAITLLPAVYIYLCDIFKVGSGLEIKYSKLKGIVTILAFLLSGASSGYLALFLMLLFLSYNKNLLNVKSLSLFLLPVVIYFGFFLFNLLSAKSQGFSIRVDHTFYAFLSDESENEKAAKINTSSFALYSNYKIAMQSFLNNPISGSGLGTHALNYEKYFYSTFSNQAVKRFVHELNKQDANSTFLRLVSETGLIGVCSFLLFLFKWLLLKRYSKNQASSFNFLILLNQGIFILIIIRLLRTGNYIGNGFFFFFFYYWAVYKLIKSYSQDLVSERTIKSIGNSSGALSHT